MIRYLPEAKLGLGLSLIALLVLLLISACDVVRDLLGREVEGPTQYAILAPRRDATGRIIVQARNPVQIQSSYPITAQISRVELRVQGPGDETPKLIRSDVPVNGYLLQEWVPQEPVTYTVRVVPLDQTNRVLANLSRQIEAIESAAIGGATPAPAIAAGAFEPPTPSPTPGIPLNPTEVMATETAPQAGEAAGASADAAVAVAVVQVVASPTPTPTLRYPPPPPIPGVPPGPVLSDPDYGPPVCDAAQYEGVYTGDTRRRVVITEDDDVPAEVVAGTTVFRAWRLRNIGLCTWGPGYELAFYGGRSMGSGGVAFESTFPADPPRRNLLLDANRLVVPEGRPNEVAVLEVMLNVPATPGIHQSYWRMRNPAGIYFGPIIGVTLDVVRECQFGIYGAPVINQFEIIGVGNVYRPADPVSVLAEIGKPVTLEYNIINANSFDIVFEDPTGNVQSVSTTDPSGRVTFPVTRVGRHVITLYADNGSCLAVAQVFVEGVPPADEQFTLDVILSSASACAGTTAEGATASSTIASGNVTAQWQHFDEGVNRFNLIGQGYRRVYGEQCPFVESIFGWQGHCYQGWGDWEPAGDPVDVLVSEDGPEAGSATIANMERRLVNAACTDSSNEECAIRYVMQARKDGQPAQPALSNTVDVLCSPARPGLPTEIREAGATNFKPQ